jgi:hypothetical protein
MEMTMLGRVPEPRRVPGGGNDAAAVVSGARDIVTLPILADCQRYGEHYRVLGGRYGR